jgi:hypothetical protein
MAPARPALEVDARSARRVRLLKPVRVSPAALAIVLALILVAPAPGPAAQVEQKTLIDNERVTVVELVFPAGFRQEHAATGSSPW